MLWKKKENKIRDLHETLLQKTRENILYKEELSRTKKAFNEMGTEFEKTSQCLYKTEILRETERKELEKLDDELKRLKNTLKYTVELLHPDILKAAKYLVNNVNNHPQGCCLKCSQGLSARDAYKIAVLKALDEIEDGYDEDATEILLGALANDKES